MAELMDSRCKACSPTQYQCGTCAKKDSALRATRRKEARVDRGKSLELLNQLRLFPSDPIAPVDVADQTAAPVAAPFPSDPIAPVVVADQTAAFVAAPFPSVFVYPPMPSPQPLFAYGQQLYPVPSDYSFSGMTSLNEYVANLQIQHVGSCDFLFCRYNNDVFNSSQDKANHPAILVTPKKATGRKSRPRDEIYLSDEYDAPPPNPKSKPKVVKFQEKAASSDGSSTSDNSSDKDGESKKESGKKMPRITNQERTAVCDWIAKTRHDGSMLNGRWIRNGGAKGSTMTATSGEVKTCGAYDALAAYINKKLRIPFSSDKYWTRTFSKKRWTAMFVVCVVCGFFL